MFSALPYILAFVAGWAVVGAILGILAACADDVPWPPSIGGSNVIKNLWPESYAGPWNARIKDRLENRLHKLVCTNKIPLPTAQHEIATNWIRAYKTIILKASK